MAALVPRWRGEKDEESTTEQHRKIPNRLREKIDPHCFPRLFVLLRCATLGFRPVFAFLSIRSFHAAFSLTRKCLHPYLASSRLLTSRFVALVSENIAGLRMKGKVFDKGCEA